MSKTIPSGTRCAVRTIREEQRFTKVRETSYVSLGLEVCSGPFIGEHVPHAVFTEHQLHRFRQGTFVEVKTELFEGEEYYRVRPVPPPLWMWA